MKFNSLWAQIYHWIIHNSQGNKTVCSKYDQVYKYFPSCQLKPLAIVWNQQYYNRRHRSYNQPKQIFFCRQWCGAPSGSRCAWLGSAWMGRRRSWTWCHQDAATGLPVMTREHRLDIFSVNNINHQLSILLNIKHSALPRRLPINLDPVSLQAGPP